MPLAHEFYSDFWDTLEMSCMKTKKSQIANTSPTLSPYDTRDSRGDSLQPPGTNMHTPEGARSGRELSTTPSSITRATPPAWSVAHQAQARVEGNPMAAKAHNTTRGRTWLNPPPPKRVTPPTRRHGGGVRAGCERKPLDAPTQARGGRRPRTTHRHDAGSIEGVWGEDGVGVRGVGAMVGMGMGIVFVDSVETIVEGFQVVVRSVTHPRGTQVEHSPTADASDTTADTSDTTADASDSTADNTCEATVEVCRCGGGERAGCRGEDGQGWPWFGNGFEMVVDGLKLVARSGMGVAVGLNGSGEVGKNGGFEAGEGRQTCGSAQIRRSGGRRQRLIQVYSRVLWPCKTARSPVEDKNIGEGVEGGQTSESVLLVTWLFKPNLTLTWIHGRSARGQARGDEWRRATTSGDERRREAMSGDGGLNIIEEVVTEVGVYGVLIDQLSPD
ncbi:hypothetical protein C8R45DRAFT_937682 [Mycena sanguinolenta]|nr:hypothetical protein C8R45DRAFT_937682 [Mycena sanguinolenta]